MKLPETKTLSRRRLDNSTMLIYGQAKIGKSSFAAKFDKALFLATEPGLNALEVYQIPIKSWDEFLDACAIINKGEHDFTTIVVDTIDILYKLCNNHFCKKMNVAHESDKGFGKIYGLVRNELHRTLTKLASLPYGLILVSHSQYREVLTKDGKRHMTVTTMPEKFQDVVMALVDMILFFDTHNTANGLQRIIRTKPHPNYYAGDRFSVLPPVLPLNFEAFKAAFEKGQIQPDEEIKEEKEKEKSSTDVNAEGEDETELQDDSETEF